MRRRAFLGGVAGVGIAQSARPKGVNESAGLLASVRAVGLSVGISTYHNGQNLPSAIRDAWRVGLAFREIGFSTEIVEDVDQAGLLGALARLRIRAANAEVVVVYVASHGFLSGGQSQILCSDAVFDETDLPLRSVPDALIVHAVSERPRQKILFLDCCRKIPNLHNSNGINRSAGASSSFAGVHMCYAAQPGAAAIDGEDKASPFAAALSNGLGEPGLDMAALCLKIRLAVVQKTGGAQIPWERSSLLTPITLNSGKVGRA